MSDKIYAVYKENTLPLVGGVNPEGATIVASYNDWKLVEIDADEFSKFSEFKLYPIDKKIALGLILNGNIRSGEPIDSDVEPDFGNDDLTDDEKKLIEMSKKYMDML